MQFTKRLHGGVRSGAITCSVRIWQRPKVKAGARYASNAGPIEIDSVERIALDDVTPALARASGFDGVVDLLKIAKHGPGENVYLVRFHVVDDVKAPARARVSSRTTRAKPATANAERGKKPRKEAKAARARVTKLVEKWPEAKTVAVGAHLGLEVRKKRFAWLLDDHHGDGRVALQCKASAEAADVIRTIAPVMFHVPKYVGSKGWIGLWLDVDGVDWALVARVVRDGYTMTAPKALVRALDDGR